MRANQATRWHRERGLALLMTLLLTTVLVVLVGGLLASLQVELGDVAWHGRSNSALAAARAGVEDMLVNFEENDSGRAVGIVPATIAKSFVDADGAAVSYSVNVDPKRWNSTLPYYVIHASGSNGAATRRLDALVRKKSFSAYALFTISENNNVGGTVWYTNGQEYDGPVYSGGPMNIIYQPGDDANPIFRGPVLTASPPDWREGSPADRVSQPSDWLAVSSGGAGGFNVVGNPQTLPTSQDNQLVANEAFSGGAAAPGGFPTAAGVYVNGQLAGAGATAPLETGIYVRGDTRITATYDPVAQMQVFIFTPQSGLPVTVIVNFATGTTTVSAPNATPTVYQGTASGQQPAGVEGGNGAIFVDGNVTVDAGSTVHGQYMLAVPDSGADHGDVITLLGSLRYSDASSTSADEFGMWANDIVLKDPRNENVEVDGVMLTGYFDECKFVCNDGTFLNYYCTSMGPCGGGIGKITLFGSLIENVRGKLGTVGSTRSGFLRQNTYDSRLSKSPPPFTPTTNQYELVALCAADGGNGCGSSP